ncbi:ATP-dependent acyl-CoA ligase [Rhodococcus sp. Eu-32]|uniref:AMP-binding protein n=1 Tax=Rhodococcus sp. Eu-32 TaxID=1017319 RepID=UPI000DF22AE5|nr:AMP-binding protein [Rhodococcus sp. Eu-32]RRQ25535.1 ATP-dependent acyl-CoA ligase [Rhodococcus sp. Eu-32]
MSTRAFPDLGGGTIGGLLASRAAANPNKVAVICNEVSRTYRALDAAARVIGSALLELGCQKSESVAIYLSNTIEFLETWMGTATAGLVQVPINTAYKQSFLEHALAHPDVRVLITESSLVEALLELPALPECVETIVFIDRIPPSIRDCGRRVIGWGDLVAMGDPDYSFPPVRPSDITAIQLTSGTTGKSKGVELPHLHNLVGAREGAEAMGNSQGDRIYTCLPLFHGAAQINIFLRALYLGATSVIAPKFSARKFWNDIRSYEVTEFNALGSMLPVLLAQPPSEQDREHAVRRIFAAPAPADVLYRFEDRFGVHIVEGYGSTEMKNVLHNPLDNRRVGSLGKPTASTILEIHDENGNRAPAGSVGEIVYRPKQPHVMFTRYYRDPEATLAVFHDLWFHTGDLGFMDQDGFFYFVDRKKDALRRRGENISSQEIESILTAFPSVLDAAVVAVPSELGEDEILAVIHVEDPGNFDMSALFAHNDALMPHFMVPRFYRAVDSLPRTPTGKIRKVELRETSQHTDIWDAHHHGHRPTRRS